jgi:GNAT superfamily N-acetyltransferase
MDIRIRRASVNDLSHLLHHRRGMFEEMGYRDPAMLECVEDLSRHYFEDALCRGAYKAWLAEDLNGRVLGGGGIVIADWPGYPGEKQARRAWILNMYTEPEARRRGIAKQLVTVMVEWCRANQFRAVSLHASDAGRPLYASLGFQPSNEMSLALR